MDVLSHSDSSLIGSFLTDIPNRCVNIELSAPKNTKALLLVSASEEIFSSDADSRQVFSLVLDANFFSFLSGLVGQKQSYTTYPFSVEKAALLVKNSRLASVAAQFYLIVAGEGLSETFEIRAKKVTLESQSITRVSI